jgi:hypothetical protein
MSEGSLTICKLRRASWLRRSDSVRGNSRDPIAIEACCPTTKVAFLRVFLDRLYEADSDPSKANTR